MRGGLTGSDPIDDRQAHLALGIEIVGAHCVAIDRRIIEGRHIDRSDDIIGKHTPCRLAQRHGLASADRRDAFSDQTLGIGDRKQRTGESETIVAEAAPSGPSPRRAAWFHAERADTCARCLMAQHREEGLHRGPLAARFEQ